jgi:hypothetical protein
MAVYKLSLDDWQESHFELIAIHTSLENFRLAFFMNRELQILLNRVESTLKIASNPVIHHYNRFEFTDEKNDISWFLLENKSLHQTLSKNTSGLFGKNEMMSSTQFLIPEAKKADFICKIEGEKFQINSKTICQKIKNIPLVNMVYPLDSQKIKFKNHLILS